MDDLGLVSLEATPSPWSRPHGRYVPGIRDHFCFRQEWGPHWSISRPLSVHPDRTSTLSLV